MGKISFSRFLLLGMALLTLSGIIALQRLHTYHEPQDCDISFYAVIADELLDGRNLYADLWDTHPPIIHPTYAAAEKLAGYGPGELYLLGVAAAILTLLGVFTAGFGLTGSVATGLWAGLFWTLICSDPRLQANQPNAEVFINLTLVWAFALIVKARNRSLDIGRYLLIGLLFALASLYKTVIVSTAIGLSVVQLAFPPPGENARPRALLQILAIGAVGLIAWVGVCAYFYAVGRFEPFYSTLFIYDRFYAGNILTNLGEGVGLTRLVPPYLYFSALLVLIAGLGLGMGCMRGPRRPWMLFLGLAVGTQISVSMPGKFFAHYYQLWLPLLAIGAAWGIEEIARALDRRSLVPFALGLAAVILLAAYELPFYRLSADEWPRLKHGELFGNLFVETRNVGLEIGRLLKPEETFYEWGFDAGLYFYSRRRPATGVFYFLALTEGPLADALSTRVLEDLQRHQPELFVQLIQPERFLRSKSGQEAFQLPRPLQEWVSSQYQVYGAKEPFLLFVRRGGKLEARIKENRPAN